MNKIITLGSADSVVQQIQAAKNIIISTHRECDGDGLGAELAMYHALKKLNKNVRALNVDETARKYFFLEPQKHLQHIRESYIKLEPSDLCLIFDTNDHRLIGKLYPLLEQSTKKIIFIDHHPPLQDGPQPTHHSWIDTSAASTGELAYHLIKKLGVALDREICRCLYTSITFDTHLYRFVRNSPISHRIAAELLEYQINPEEIHRALFGNQTIQKVAFMAKTLGDIEYHKNGRVALIKIYQKDLEYFKLDGDEARDVIDTVMNIDSVEAAILLREDGINEFKVSLRSKGKVVLLELAEELGGGGHPSAAGAHVYSDEQSLKQKILKKICDQII